VAADSPVPLCSSAQFTEGSFKDLASAVEPGTLADFLIEATRLCEESADRRLAPFTETETHRAEGMDPDEYADSANMPMDIYGSLGTSYAQSLGVNGLTRHCWIHEFPPRYPEMWAYSNVTVEIIRSYGGNQVLAPTQILDGPDDTGHIWFQLGLYLPIASRVRVTYSGGYSVAIPASLVRACKYMTASIICRELNPDDSAHDPDLLREDATAILAANWARA
jgi:hypothetical protein